MYSGYIITFDSAGFWSFANGSTRNLISFGVDNSWSSHADICKKNFLVLGEDPTFGINRNFGLAEKKVFVNFSKANTKLWISIIMLIV